MNELAIWTPDIVLLDLALPDSSTDETPKSIVRIVRTAPVAVLTGNHTAGRWKQCLELGATAFLAKERYLPEPNLPFLMDAITNSILLWKVRNEQR